MATEQVKNIIQAEFKDVQIERRGETISLPDKMTYDTAIDWLQKRKLEEERVVCVDERLEGFPLDCANALQLAVQERYGFKELKSTGIFGTQPPLFISTPTDHRGGTVEVFVGRFGIPNLDPKSYLQSYANGFDSLGITGNVKHKEMKEVKALVALAREKLISGSIYKSKAIRIGWEQEVSFMGSSEGFGTPTFMPPKPATDKLLVNDDTQFLIEASIWAMLRQTARCRSLNVPLKRSALCEGPFGVGKTLLAATTAQIAIENGWTFIYLNDIERLKEAYRLAARYQPCVLFAEDLDIAMSGSHADNHALLNVLDGIDTKGAEVMLILTTNHADKLDQSILRPGRLDAVIPFRAPDSKTAEALVRHYAGELLAPNADLTSVGEALDGRIPAVIREVVERAKLHALADSSDGNIVLDEVALKRSAIGMAHHLKMLDEQAPKPSESAMEQFGNIIGKSIMAGVYAAANGASSFSELINKNGTGEKMMKAIEANVTRR